MMSVEIPTVVKTRVEIPPYMEHIYLDSLVRFFLQNVELYTTSGGLYGLRFIPFCDRCPEVSFWDYIWEYLTRDGENPYIALEGPPLDTESKSRLKELWVRIPWRLQELSMNSVI